MILPFSAGKLIGHGGQFIKSVKALSRCHIDIEKNRDRGKPTQIQEFQTVMLEGTRWGYTIHPISSKAEIVCLLSELATGWKAGSGFHSALGWLTTPEFIYEKSLLSS